MNLLDYWEKQRKQNLKYWIKTYNSISSQERESRTLKHIMHCIDNLLKMQNETEWKLHLVQKKDVESKVNKNFIYHSVDVFKHIISLLILYGYSAEDFIIALKDKDYLIEKMNGFRFPKPNLRFNFCVCIDLDGVIFNYRGGMADFLNSKGYKAPEVFDHYHIWKDIPGLTYNEYENLYEEFVMSGGYRELEVFGRKHFIKNLANSIYDHFSIVFVSSRPVDKYKNIAQDTYFSLEKRGFKFDAVVFGKDKAEIIEELHPVEVRFFIDDVVKHVVEVSQIGIKSYLISKRYNDYFDSKSENIAKVNSFSEFCEDILEGKDGGNVS